MTLVQRWSADIPLLQTSEMRSTHILVLPPLFEEANRMRRTIVQLMRILDTHGHGVTLPDLPGMGENPALAAGISLREMTDALARLSRQIQQSSQRTVVASFRSGALLDHAVCADGYWRFAPEDGASLLRVMDRMPRDFSDYLSSLTSISRECVGTSSLSERDVLRTVRLTSDKSPACLRVTSPPLWRWAEPGEVPGLAETLANDLSLWTSQCASS